MKTERWSSRATFLFATIGCAVGLGNLWRFPYIAGENGGGAFVLVYLGFVLMAGIPLIMANWRWHVAGAATPWRPRRQSPTRRAATAAGS